MPYVLIALTIAFRFLPHPFSFTPVGALGLFAGVVAVVGAEVTVLILQTQVFELKAAVHPWLWVTGPLIGAALILLVGILGTRQLIAAPPITVLRGLN